MNNAKVEDLMQNLIFKKEKVNDFTPVRLESKVTSLELSTLLHAAKDMVRLGFFKSRLAACSNRRQTG